MKLYKMLNKTTKGRKKVEDKSRSKKQGQWIENMVSNIVDINLTISIIILNVNSLNVWIKRGCQSGLKNKTQIYVLYKKSTLDIKPHIYEY